MPVADLKDVRPPVDLPPNYFLLFVFLGLIVLAALFFLFCWLLPRLKSKTAVPVVVRPAWEIANEELAALEKENLPGRGEAKEYFSRLSDIVRHYLERRFSVSAPEMTTDEFLLHVKTMVVLHDQHKESLKEFLIASDMVKFARYGSSVGEMTKAFTVAKRLVDETIP